MPVRQPYKRLIVAEITRRIEQQETGYRSGDQLPYDAQLAAEFECSIGPVKAAMEILSERGLIERHQGLGTFVAPRTDE